MSILSRDIWDLAAGRLTPDGEQRIREALKNPLSEVRVFLERPRSLPEDRDEFEEWPEIDDEHDPARERLSDHVSQARSSKWLPLLRTAALLLFALIVGLGMGAVYTTIFLKADFDKGVFDREVWKEVAVPDTRAKLEFQSGFARLVNRAPLVTQKEYPGPLEISFDWKWIDTSGKGPSQYEEHLTIALKTTGSINAIRPFEASDGILIKFECFDDGTEGDLRIFRAPLSIVDAGNDLIISAGNLGGLFKITPDTWHHVRIVDSERTLSVYFDGSPILENIAYEAPKKGRRIAVYNREHVAFRHESWIDNFVVKSLPE